jgi:GAF domain-containing protein/HAMP domain-containing protein
LEPIHVFNPPTNPVRQKPDRLPERFFSLRWKALLVFLGLTGLTAVILSALAFTSAESLNQRAQTVSANALSRQAEDYLVQLNRRAGAEYDAGLSRGMSAVTMVAQAAALAYDHPSDPTSGVGWPVDELVFSGPNGQWMNSETAVTSVFAPNTRRLEAAVRQDLILGSSLDHILPGVLAGNPNAQAVYFATPNDTVRYFPNINLGKVLPADFQATRRPWFTGSLSDQNPNRRAWWTPVYQDATGLGLVTTIAAPVYSTQGQLVGVVGLDLTLDELRSSIESTRFLDSGYLFLIDHTGRPIALPRQAALDFLGHEAVLKKDDPTDDFNTDLRINLSPAARKANLSDVIDRMVSGESGLKKVRLEGSELWIAYIPLHSTGWSLGTVVTSSDVLDFLPVLRNQIAEQTRQLLWTQAFPIILLLMTVLVALVIIATNLITGPIQKLAAAARKVSLGNLETPFQGESNDEIGLLAETLEEMRSELQTLFGRLEVRVNERTRSLERRSIQLQTASQVARDITSAPGLGELLERSVNLIRDQFGFYHAGIFLVDEMGEYAVLQAATGEAGKALMARGHKLKVGSVGLVGYAAGYGQARIALDVGQDAVHFKNPLLPGTRSELALPLKIASRVIGALNVQSEQESAFSDEDVTVLQTLADQLAVAIDNTRLVERLEKSLQETRILTNEHSRQSWSLTPAYLRHTAFEYDRIQVRPISAAPILSGANPDDSIPPSAAERLKAGQLAFIEKQPTASQSQETPKSEKVLLAPLILRDQLIGVLRLEREDGSAWIEDDLAIVRSAAAQAALTLENARLLEESRRHAEQEAAVRQVASRIRETLDVGAVLRRAVGEIGSRMEGAEVEIRLLSQNQAPIPSGSNPGSKEVE